MCRCVSSLFRGVHGLKGSRVGEVMTGTERGSKLLLEGNILILGFFISEGRNEMIS